MRGPPRNAFKYLDSIGKPRPKKEVEIIEIGPQEGPQSDFMGCSADIAIYGGAAGGGKTYAILLDNLRNFNMKEGGAVCFRRTSKQVRSQGGLWDTSVTLYNQLGAEPRESTLDWTFPNGWKLTFAHLEYEKNKFDWQGSQIPVIYFDELTHFTETQFTYMMTRNRSTCGIRPYIRATCNPDSKSWVKKWIQWYIDEDSGLPIPERAGVIRYFYIINDRMEWGSSERELMLRFPEVASLSAPKSFTFIPSKLDDNKILNEKDPSYRANLMAQNKVERERLMNGNWNIEASAGMFFKKSYFEEVEAIPQLVRVVRAWDRAATEWSEGDKGDPDATAGVKLGVDKNGIYYILDAEHERISAYKVEQLIRNTAIQDGQNCTVKAFQDPGSAGKGEAELFVRKMAGFDVHIETISRDKVTSAKAVSAQAEAGNVKVLKTCRNKQELYDELENFPEGSHDDLVDALSSAFNYLALESHGQWSDDGLEFNEEDLSDTLIEHEQEW